MMDGANLMQKFIVGDYVILVYDVVLVLVHISRVVHSLRGADTVLAQHANRFLLHS